jgi:molybdenum cofactor cytidylyltransferase
LDQSYAFHDVDAVILAAGISSRCPQYKLALPLGERSVIEHTVEGLYPFVDRVIVVVGWREETVRALLAAFSKITFVANHEYEQGMFSSVRAGVSAVRAARFFLQPADMPLVDPAVYTRLLATEADIVIPTYGGRKGHPVLIRRGVIDDILGAPHSATLRDVLAARGYASAAVEDEGILLDIDTMADYDDILARFAARQS